MTVERTALRLREARFPDDAAAIVRITNQYDSEPVSVEEYVRQHDTWRSDDPRAKFVVEADGEVIGFAHSRRREPMTRGMFFLTLYVDRERTRLGAGRLLAQAGEAFAQNHGAVSLTAFVPEDDPRGRGFAESRGYALARHLFESTMDVDTTSDAEIEAETAAVAAASGVRYTTLAALGQTTETEDLVYEIGTECDLDEPGTQEYGPVSREDYQRLLFSAPWFRPEGVIVALDGDHWAGIHVLGPLADSEVADFTVDFTGVRRPYRGKGLARALKLLGVKYARSQGGTRLITHNDSTNAAMLAVNRRLGYVPRPGILMMKKEF